MTSDSVLIRKSDRKEFKVKFLSHWSHIQDSDGETDTVKWVGGDDYVSHSKGHMYCLKDPE